MNPIYFDITLIVQVISFFIMALFICGIIYIFTSVIKKRNEDKETIAKLYRIIELLENEKKS